jgi:hypothetical protein
MDFDAWVLFARRYGLESWAVFALDAFEPLAPLGAQTIYALGPVMGLGRSATHSLARMLEDDQARDSLRRRLMSDSVA